MNKQAMQQFQAFVKQFKQTSNGLSPQQIVQNLLNNGQMSQQQYNQCRSMANQIMGTKF